MRKLFNSLLVIIAAMVTFAGCAKEETEAPAQTKTVQFFAESIETKTAFGAPDGTTYPTLWTANDEKVEVSMNLESSSKCEIQPSDDFKTARFETSIEDDETGSYTFYSVSPASANISFSASYKSYNLEIPTVQTPSANSVDEKSQILVAKSATFDAFPASVNLTYEHFTAYGKMSLANLNLGGATMSSVTLTASKNFAYRYYYYPATGTFNENGATKTITINTSSVSDIWFACAPVDMSNSTIEVVVNTDKGTFSKTITFPANRKFEAGKIAKFSVDMDGVNIVAPKVYELVTDSADLTEGSQVVIVSGEYAMSTNQKANNRGTAGVTLSADKKSIGTPGPDVQIFTIETGNVVGTIAFNTGSGYIYAASSSSNHLKTETTLSDNSSWLVTISEGVATIKAQGTNTRNWLRYNSSSSLFACYSSGQADVSIYKLQGSGTVLENYLNVSPANISVDAGATSASFTVSSDLEWTATSDNATVSKDGNTVTVSFDENQITNAKTYTVTVAADGVEPKTVTITQAGKVTKMTIAEVISATLNTNVETEGLVVAKSTKGIIISDATGLVQVYANANVQATIGDLVSVSGNRDAYNNWAQITSPSVTILSSNNTVTYPTVNSLDGTGMDNLLQATSVSYIQYIGTLSVSGNYYNINVEGATTAIGSAQYPLSDFGLSNLNGKKVKVSGYHVGISSSKYVNTMVTAVEVVEDTTEPEQPEQPGGQKIEYTILFGANYNSSKVSSYASTWSVTNNGFTCNLANWNNNNNGWAYVKAGSKNNASVATITTANSISEALTTVKMTVDAYTSSKINSLKLYVSTSSDFTSAATYSASIATGDVAFNIISPVANAYYKIEVDCAKGSSNGLIQVSKVVYSN